MSLCHSVCTVKALCVWVSGSSLVGWVPTITLCWMWQHGWAVQPLDKHTGYTIFCFLYMTVWLLRSLGDHCLFGYDQNYCDVWRTKKLPFQINRRISAAPLKQMLIIACRSQPPSVSVLPGILLRTRVYRKRRWTRWRTLPALWKCVVISSGWVEH